MRYTLIFGTPVTANGKTLGKVERIVVQNGVANQFTVDPGLFGTERVLPLSDVQAINANGIELRVSEDEWKAYPAFNIESLLPDTVSQMPGLPAVTAQTVTAPANITDPGVPTTSVDVPADDITVPDQAHSAVVSAKTMVLHGDREHELHGLVLDTGRPVQALVGNDQALDMSTVRSVSAEQIRL